MVSHILKIMKRSAKGLVGLSNYDKQLKSKMGKIVKLIFLVSKINYIKKRRY